MTVLLSVFFTAIAEEIKITATSTTVVGYTDKNVIVVGKSEIHITSPVCAVALNNSTLQLNHEDAWLFFENIRPSVAIDSLLSYITVNGQPAVNDSTVRVTIYKHGVVIMPFSQDFKPLKVFTSPGFKGDSASYSLLSYHNNLGSMNNKIRSFRLKRGYMATFASNADGSGYSRVFVADEHDLEVPLLDVYLDEVISFIRIFSWEYVTKKGWCGTGTNGTLDVEKIKGTWWYSWSADKESTQNQEYVPIKQHGNWPSWEQINSKKTATHLLGFNEPNRPDQANMSVQTALAIWPEFMRSGLRLGSPSPSDPFGANGDWLYTFLDSCKARNYRVDYIAIHCYWAAKTPRQWYNDLKAVHQRTGLPIWITEWNNGANWTKETWPDTNREYTPANAAKQLNDIKGILNVLDTAGFVERYSIFNWVEDCRAMIFNGTLTPAGEYYMANKSALAFNPAKQVVPVYSFKRQIKVVPEFTSDRVRFTIQESEPDYYRGFIAERKLGQDAYEVFYETNDKNLRTFTDSIQLNRGEVRYRVRYKLADGTLSDYSQEMPVNVTSGDKLVQFGNLNLKNADWNPVFFSETFDENPVIILGSPTSNNSSVRMAPRVRFGSKETRFNVNPSPWSYQNISILPKDETIPYLALAPGKYNFGGGIKALAQTTNAIGTWTSVLFPEAFDSVPVVFVNQVNSPTTYATAVRIKDVTSTGFKIRITREKAISTVPGLDKVSYLAMTPGKGFINGHQLIVGKTASNFLTATSKVISYGDTIYNPVFIAQMQTANDDTTAVVRSYLVREQAALIFKQREISKSNSVTAAEGAGWLVFDPVPSVVQSVEDAQANALQIFPNPVAEVLYLKNSHSKGMHISIYSVTGQEVHSEFSTSNFINVSSLPPGLYLLKAGGNKTATFLKK